MTKISLRSTSLLIILFLIFGYLSSGQDVQILKDNSNANTNISDYEQVLDVNGEPCSLVIISCEIPGIKFYTNLGVEKIAYDSTGYKVWIPAKSSLLKFVVPGFPLYEHQLEEYEGPRVWIFILVVPEEKIVEEYKETEFKKVTIITNPADGVVFEGRRHIGSTPISLTHYFNESSPPLEIKRWGYKTIKVKSDTLEPERAYTLNFQKLSHQKGIFVMAELAQSWNYSLDYQAPVYGLSVGYLGRVGFYGSFGGTVYTHKDRYEPENTSEVRSLKFSLGSIFALTKSSNLRLGLGYNKSTITPEQDDQTYEDGGVYLDAGLIFRTNSPLLILLQLNFYYSNEELYPSSASAGLGWVF